MVATIASMAQRADKDVDVDALEASIAEARSVGVTNVLNFKQRLETVVARRKQAQQGMAQAIGMEALTARIAEAMASGVEDVLLSEEVGRLAEMVKQELSTQTALAQTEYRTPRTWRTPFVKCAEADRQRLVRYVCTP